jgi:hypothetical protein
MPWLRKLSASIHSRRRSRLHHLREAGRYMLALLEPHQRNGQRQYVAGQ